MLSRVSFVNLLISCCPPQQLIKIIKQAKTQLVAIMGDALHLQLLSRIPLELFGRVAYPSKIAVEILLKSMLNFL